MISLLSSGILRGFDVSVIGYKSLDLGLFSFRSLSGSFWCFRSVSVPEFVMISEFLGFFLLRFILSLVTGLRLWGVCSL